MTSIGGKINRIHFCLLGFVLLFLLIKLISGFSLNSKIIFALKILIYLSGLILFFLNLKPFKIIALYFSFYVLSALITILFWLFGGILLAISSSLLLYPLSPKEIEYERDNLKVYSKFQGFMGACCPYEIVESKLFIFEKHYGYVNLGEPINSKKSSLKIVNDSIEYKHKIRNYNKEGNMEIESDTIEKIKIE